MTCALCLQNEAKKKNTHYLTDSIIRTALNENGSNKREKGKYFDMSNTNEGVEFNFQRNTSVSKLIKDLGRELTEEEIERAKNVPFSVDDVFCGECENRFTDIETPFIQTILPEFRSQNLDNCISAEFGEIRIIRLFFLLQIWRTSICEEDFNISDEVSERLRNIILNHVKISDEELKEFPLLVSYLQTSGEAINYTGNIVGITSDNNPNIILMNDFVIQFYENIKVVQFFDFFNLNSQDDYEEFINFDEESFSVKVISDDKRIEFNKALMGESKAKSLLDFCVFNFTNMYGALFGKNASKEIVGSYLDELIKRDLNKPDNFSNERLRDFTIFFIEKLAKKI